MKFLSESTDVRCYKSCGIGVYRSTGYIVCISVDTCSFASSRIVKEIKRCAHNLFSSLAVDMNPFIIRIIMIVHQISRHKIMIHNIIHDMYVNLKKLPNIYEQNYSIIQFWVEAA